MKTALLAATIALSGAAAVHAQTAAPAAGTGGAASAGTAASGAGSSDGTASGMTGAATGTSMTSSGMAPSGAASDTAAGSGVTGAAGTGTTMNGVAADTAGNAPVGSAAPTTSTGQPADTSGTNAAAPVRGTAPVGTAAPATPAVAPATNAVTTAAVQTQPKTAQEFVDAAASGGLFEVESSKLALERSKSDAVKAFARMMIDDHTKANDELKAIATGASLNVPTAPQDGPADHLKAVQDAADADFDRTYIQHQTQAHDETVALFTAQAGSTQTPELAAFAARTLPTIKMHAEHARMLAQ